MKKVVTVFYSFQEFDDLLRRCCFTNKELFDVEIVDRYFGRINYYPDDPNDGVEELHLSDFDALPVLSKIVGMKLTNTHASHDGIWLEGEELLPAKTRTKKKKP